MRQSVVFNTGSPSRLSQGCRGGWFAPCRCSARPLLP